MERIVYLDNAATTKPDYDIINEISKITNEYYGNPSSIYNIGQESKGIIYKSQMKIASALGCNPEEIIFTSGGTESNNLAIFGTIKQTPDKRHIITTSIEHPSVLNVMEYLETQGYRITYLPVDHNGCINKLDVIKNICEDTTLISIMFVNNEIGSIQPISEIGKIAKEHGIKFHCDAIQAMGCKKINVNDLGVDLLSISGHKIYIPKGIGCLYSRDAKVSNIMYGGHQQNEKRPGTENIGYIHGLGIAIESINNYEFDRKLRDYALDRLKTIPNITFNGKTDSHIINFRIHDIKNEFLIIKLGLKGIYISGGSACNSSQHEYSHVIEALGLDTEDCKACKESVRISLGKYNTEEDIDIFVNTLKEII